MASFTALPMEDQKNRSAMRGANEENFTYMSGHAFRPPTRFIYIHTVARKTPPKILRKLFPGLILQACERGERFVTCACIGDPVPEPVKNEMTGAKDINEHDGWRAVIDVLNPRNYSNDPFAGSQNPDFFSNRNGSNLIAEGFWPSLNKEPTEEEIKRAESFRSRRYRWLTGEATRLAAVSTKDLNEFLQTYPDTHIAMDALGISANWHTLNVVQATCPNCGDQIKEGLAFHKSSVTDKLCVIDPERAYKAKAITKEEYEELVTEPETEKKQRQSRIKPIV